MNTTHIKPNNNPNAITICNAAAAYPFASSRFPRPKACAACTCPPILASALNPCASHTYMPPTPTPATAFEPSMPIHAMSVMLYAADKNADAIIGNANFITV